MNRKIEIFTAGCPICDEHVQKIKETACPSCDIEVLNVNSSPEALRRSREFNIKSLPSVVIDGMLADCCSNRGVDLETLKSLGLGVPK
ncbi:MAG: thioredoxin family protein [Ignavibacteria bacterium]